MPKYKCKVMRMLVWEVEVTARSTADAKDEADREVEKRYNPPDDDYSYDTQAELIEEDENERTATNGR